MGRPARIVIGVIFVLCLGIGTLFGERNVVQPYPYNHAAHTTKANCTVCHRGARTRQRAGLPGLEVCTRCHATAPGAAPTAAHRALWKRVLDGKAPRWNRLLRLPTHVYFSHQRHVTVGGIECKRCHGNMKHRQTPPPGPLVALKMRDCISCHESRKVTVDCTACHR